MAHSVESRQVQVAESDRRLIFLNAMSPRLLLAVALTLTVACGGSGAAGSAPSSSSPTSSSTPSSRALNVLVVMTDDQDAASVREMPRVQALLAQQGVVFPNAFATTPLCSPSRASILTGQYAHNHGVRHNSLPLGGFQALRTLGAEARAFPVWLKSAGYRTGYMGKYFNDFSPGWGAAPSGWDEWVALTEPQRYTEFTFNDNGVDRTAPSGAHQTDFLADRAISFLRAAESRDDQPFLLFLSPYAPHGVSVPATRHQSMFDAAGAPRTPNFDEPDVSDKPAHIRRIPRFTADEVAARDRAYRDALRTLQGVDEMVERLVSTLRELGELESTMIFFLSDNGYSFGSHRFTDKKAPYEESLQIPFIVRGPGVPAGTRLGYLVANIDVAPTIAELARIGVPAHVDGRSLAPLLVANPPALSAATWREDLLIEFWFMGRDALPDYIGVRRETASESQMFAAYPTGDREVYDLRSDPYQLEGRESDRPETAGRLHQRALALSACSGANCR